MPWSAGATAPRLSGSATPRCLLGLPLGGLPCRGLPAGAAAPRSAAWLTNRVRLGLPCHRLSVLLCGGRPNCCGLSRLRQWTGIRPPIGKGGQRDTTTGANRRTGAMASRPAAETTAAEAATAARRRRQRAPADRHWGFGTGDDREDDRRHTGSCFQTVPPNIIRQLLQFRSGDPPALTSSDDALSGLLNTRPRARSSRMYFRYVLNINEKARLPGYGHVTSGLMAASNRLRVCVAHRLTSANKV